MTNIRGRQEEIFEILNAYRTTQNIFRTRQTELRSFVEANRSIMDNLVSRMNMSRFIRNNVGLIPTLNSSTNKTDFMVTASHNTDTAWKVLNASPAFRTAGIPTDSEGTYTQLVHLQIQLPVAARIFRIGVRARSDTQKVLEWQVCGNNDGGMGSIIYNPENIAIGGTARYLDVPLNQPEFTHYRLVINPSLGVGSKMTPEHPCIWSIEVKKGYDGFHFFSESHYMGLLNFPIKCIFYFIAKKNLFSIYTN